MREQKPRAAMSLFLSMPIPGSDRNTCAAQLQRSKAVLLAEVRGSTDREIPLWGKIFFHVFTTLYFGLNLGAGAFLFTTRENFFAAGGFDEIYFAAEEVFFTVALKRLGRFKLLREPAITSGRKLRMYSGWKIFGRSLSLIFGGPRGVMSRKKLDLWYGGEREKTHWLRRGK